MPIASIALDTDAIEVPKKVADFLTAATGPVEAWLARTEDRTGRGFVPSDYVAVAQGLIALRGELPDARSFCEWGSGLGVAVGIAALLGFDAYGIEISARLVERSREILAEHGISASIEHGSFVPEDYVRDEELSDADTRTVLWGPEAWPDMDVGMADIDIVFAFPWPTDEDWFCDLFEQNADYGAVLLTYAGEEGVVARRKVP